MKFKKILGIAAIAGIGAYLAHRYSKLEPREAVGEKKFITLENEFTDTKNDSFDTTEENTEEDEEEGQINPINLNEDVVVEEFIGETYSTIIEEENGDEVISDEENFIVEESELIEETETINDDSVEEVLEDKDDIQETIDYLEDFEVIIEDNTNEEAETKSVINDIANDELDYTFLHVVDDSVKDLQKKYPFVSEEYIEKLTYLKFDFSENFEKGTNVLISHEIEYYSEIGKDSIEKTFIDEGYNNEFEYVDSTIKISKEIFISDDSSLIDTILNAANITFGLKCEYLGFEIDHI